MQSEVRKQLNANKFFDYAVSKSGLSKHRYFSCKALKIESEKISEKNKTKLSSFTKKQIAICIIAGIILLLIEIGIAFNVGAKNILEHRKTSKSYSLLAKTAPKTLDDCSIKAKDAGIKYINKKEQEEAKRREDQEIKAKAAKSIINPNWRGVPLSSSRGSQEGPSGKETYYNLNMSSVVSIMRGMGYDEANYPYHVREDGAKMIGRFILVAANLNLRPRGTLVTTSMGIGIVADTGGFAARNPTQIDIATNW